VVYWRGTPGFFWVAWFYFKLRRANSVDQICFGFCRTIDEARRCYFLRSLDRFAAFFGLAELKPESQELFPNSYVIGKSALLDRFVTFS